MEIGRLTEVVSKGMSELPKPLRVTLESVEVLICKDIKQATEELRQDFEEFDPLPADCKGVYVGDPLETEDEDDGSEVQTLPDGVIILVADNIIDEKEAAIVLMHEIGHALDMTEEEVGALGLGVEPTSAKPSDQPTS